ncbi:MAG: type III-B CRISPR module RAMP protein Cmr4 [Acidobacteriota bacterium]
MSEYSFQQVFYRCITPLHVGCGQDVGVVDLPIFRERTTGYPLIPGSGIRGTLRDRLEGKDRALTRQLMGSDDPNKISAGCVSVLDARILLFPVRSLPSVFVWITCPYALDRYCDDHEHFLGRKPTLTRLPKAPDDEHYLGNVASQGKLWLEEFPFERSNHKWSWDGAVDGVAPNRVVAVSDTVFDYFVRNATIIIQHNRLTSAKTVEGGALFSVESVPPEAVFYSFLGATDERRVGNDKLTKEDVLKKLRASLTGKDHGIATHVTLGGDESTGLGVTKMTWAA